MAKMAMIRDIVLLELLSIAVIKFVFAGLDVNALERAMFIFLLSFA